MSENTTILNIETKAAPKRFATLDFTRGLAIVLMLVLHLIGDTLNIPELLSNINNIPLINLLAIVILPFYGGLAGLFLIISAIGNMISMFKQLEKGNSVKGLVTKQIISGVLLLIFAMLSEGLIGYHGSIGSFFLNLNNPQNTDWSTALWRWNMFETVHTIAWCVIINGIIQGLLSLKKNWKNIKQMIVIYAALAFLIVTLTQPVWNFIQWLVPGYPFWLDSFGREIFMPTIGSASFWVILRSPFLAALAAPMEPLFPYLAISFIGSIIGIVLSQPQEKISKHFPRTVFLFGLGMFIVGLIGVVMVMISVLNNASFDEAIQFYQLISFHRHWAPDYASYVPPYAWVWQFLSLNGYSIMLVMFLFRMIEFRGKTKPFANNTKFVRRYGIVAFSNYNNQWINWIIFCLTSLMFTGIPYGKMNWAGTLFTVLLTLVVFELLLIGWEKIKYLGSLEWFIKTATNNLISERRKQYDKNTKWWQKGLIDVENIFYRADWINITREEEINHTALEESKLSLKLSLIGLFSIIFIPLNIISLITTIQSIRKEKWNNNNKAALTISIIGVVLLLAFLITSFILPIGVLGIF